MRQNIGMLVQTLGYIILSLSIVLETARKFVNFKREQMPIEIRILLRLIKIKNNDDYARIFDGKEYPALDQFTLKERIKYDLPLIAFVLIVLGVLLSINYEPIVNVIRRIIVVIVGHNTN